MQALVFLCIRANPNAGLSDLVDIIRQAGFDVSLSWVQRAISSWGWSWRLTAWVSKNKFSEENVFAWAQYCNAVLSFPWRRVGFVVLHRFDAKLTNINQLKFLDECHFEAVNVSRRRRVGPPGEPLIVVDGIPLEARLSMTLLVGVTDVEMPFTFQLRDGSNDCWDFLRFVMSAVEGGRIGRDDVLVVDNAAIHGAAEMLPHLVGLLQSVGAEMVFLPTYSPEFNPCELVFGELKGSLRQYRHPELTFRDRITHALSHIDIVNVLSYYHHCTTVALQI